MKLTIVGMSGSYAGPASPASSYLVQASDADGRVWTLVMDLGSGAFGALQKYVDPFSVDGILISHLHPDHCSDLSGYYVYYKYHPTNGTQYTDRAPIPSFAPAGAANRFADAYGLDEGDSMEEQFRHVELKDHLTMAVGPFEIETFAVNHPVEAYGFRVTGPSESDPTQRVTIGYSGDTDDCTGVRSIAKNADLFLCEAAFIEGRDDDIPAMHLTGCRAGQIARDENAKQLVLTHIPPWNDAMMAYYEARRHFAGTITIAEAAATFEI